MAGIYSSLSPPLDLAPTCRLSIWLCEYPIGARPHDPSARPTGTLFSRGLRPAGRRFPGEELPLHPDRFNARAWVSVTAVVFTALFAGCTTGQPHPRRPAYKGAKTVNISDIRFDDGDTFEIKGRPIRVLGIDTPEIAHPALGVNEAQPFGPTAAESTRVWLTRAGIIEIVYGGRDLYKRMLAHVFVDGELLACRLIRHGLAYETVSHYGDSGFPDLAQQIIDTSRASPKPLFEPPYQWKKKHRAKNRR